MTVHNVFSSLIDQFILLLEPIRAALADREQFAQLLLRHGWVVAPDTLDIAAIQKLLGVNDDLDQLDKLIEESLNLSPEQLPDLYATIIETVRQIFNQLRELTNLSPEASLPFPLREATFWAEFPESLLSDLIISYLKLHQSKVYASLLLFGIVEERLRDVGGAAGRTNYTARIIHSARFGMLWNPTKLMHEVYHWDSAPEPFDYELLTQNLLGFVEAFGFNAALVVPETSLLDEYYSPANSARNAVRELRIPIVDGMNEGMAELFALLFALLPITGAQPGDMDKPPVGIAFGPTTKGTLPTFNFAPLTLVLNGGFEAPQGIRLELRPSGAAAKFLPGATANAEAGLLYHYDEPLFLVGTDDNDHIQLEGYGAFLRIAGAANAISFQLGALLEAFEILVDLGAAFVDSETFIATVGWDRLTLLWGNADAYDFALEFTHLRVQNTLFPNFKIDVDLRLIAKDGKLSIDRSTNGASANVARSGEQANIATRGPAALPPMLTNGFRLHEPLLPGITPENVYIDSHCLALQWQDDQPNGWLNHLIPDFFTEGNPENSKVTAQMIWGKPIREIRLDWEFTGAAPTMRIPGLIKVTLPGAGFFSLVWGAGGQDLTNLAFGYTVPANNSIIFSSNFAWERGPDRELQNDANGKILDNALFVLTLTPTKNSTLILASFDLSVPTIKELFLEPATPLTALETNQPETLCHPIDALNPFSGEEWQATLTVNYEQLQLPFLKQGDNQFIDIFDPSSEPTSANTISPRASATATAGSINIPVDFSKATVEVPLGLRLRLGELNLVTHFDAQFNWRTLTIHVVHDKGIDLYTEKDVLENDFLGLHWAFRGQLETNGPNAGKYHLFTLVTKDYNYQIQQAPGAMIDLSYNGISRDPIIFRVTDFAITEKGLNLRTTVVDAPVRLNGLNTKFRFDGSGLVIENSKIASFTIAGAGALPPDLVGDSRVNIALQFGRLADSGNLTLIHGLAKLQGNKLLHCQGTRFKFSVDELGLEFVNDGKFHLYFTITGSAQFMLAEGDDAEGALALLPNIKLELVDAPLTGDVSVIGKHINFLVELPKPVSFNFLGCFEFELRGIGFEPQAEVFGGDGAMLLSGQLKFAQGGGDIIDARIDFHNLHIGLPAPGEFLPRIYFKQLAVSLAISGAFKLSAVVDFRDDPLEKGFLGEGMVDIQGLPSMAGAFGFLRVRRNENAPWLRAWFIYLEVRKVSFVVPVVQIYLREVGLGFGYRFTLTSIKAADQAGDIRKLLKELRDLSRTQGDLAKRDRWAVDLENAGQDPRWTIVLRAMISQTAASSPLTYSEASEQELSCIYLFDAVIAFRSDFTFFMAVRGWFNTNYNDYLVDDNGIRNKPFLSGFVLLAPRQKRFLAHVASNPEGKLGRHPELPSFVKSAIEAAEFSATLLIEPGLLHYEMGWPNMLRWKGKLGPLEVEFQGGFIFRISKTELVTGTSFMARGTLNVEAGISFGFFGVSVGLYARVAYGARYIGVLAFQDVTANSAFYGAIGLELYVRITIRFWIKLLFVKKSFKFSIGVGFTAALEVGILGSLEPGIRGQGTISLKAMGRSIRFGVKIGINDDAVDEAITRTNRFLNIGLESTEVEALPGLDPRDPDTEPLAAAGTAFAQRALAAEPTTRRGGILSTQKMLTAPNYTLFIVRLKDERYFVLIPAGERQGAAGYEPESGFLPTPPEQLSSYRLTTADAVTLTTAALAEDHRLPRDLQAKSGQDSNDPFIIKQGAAVRIGARDEQGPSEWLVQTVAEGDTPGETLRIVAETDTADPSLRIYSLKSNSTTADFTLNFAAVDGFDPSKLLHFNPTTQQWQPVAVNYSWWVNWQAGIVEGGQDFSDQPNIKEGEKLADRATVTAISLAEYLRGAFVECPGGVLADPQAIDEGSAMRDERVYNPTDGAFEAAVRGAFEQFRGAPFFKRDPNNSYDQALESAFSQSTSIYTAAKTESDETLPAAKNEHADQIRGLITHDLVTDLQEYVDLLQGDEPTDTVLEEFVKKSLAFQMGLVFRVTGQTPSWLEAFGDSGTVLPKIQQRLGSEPEAAHGAERIVYAFNTSLTNYRTNPPRFDQVRHYANSTTVGITWDLTWDNLPGAGCTPCQAEPEHHLLRYEVRRRSLDSQTRDLLLSVKSGDILQGPEVGENGAAQPSIIQRLRPRFQLVDHFDDLDANEITQLPAAGLSYLYTITPIDFAKNPGRPLTVVATRYPDQPPQVPANGELTVTYQLDRTATAPTLRNADRNTESGPTTPIPPIVEPLAMQVQWGEPKTSVTNRSTPIRDYQLVFRREETLPIGSYGLDSATQRTKTQLLPTTNARIRPTDIVVAIPRAQIGIMQQLVDAGVEGTKHDRSAPLDPAELRRLGIIPPAAAPEWRPEAWRVFFRTISDGGVPSALAPVQLKLRVLAQAAETPLFRPLPEERRPAELEWLPKPIQLPLLPAEDQKGLTGDAHFPMPLVNGIKIDAASVGSWRLSGFTDQVGFQPHPKGIRAIRFRWNQGPSSDPSYPLNLTAGYELLELDIDAHNSDTLGDAERLRNVLRPIQEVQLLPGEDLLLTPGDTLATNQWEAWYISALLRRNLRAATQTTQPIGGSEMPYSPWYSWRESLLYWPAWPALEAGSRDGLYHPFLATLVRLLNGDNLIPKNQRADLTILNAESTARNKVEEICHTLGLQAPDQLTSSEATNGEGNVWICSYTKVNRVALRLRAENKQLVLTTNVSYLVDLQAFPPPQPQKFTDFLRTTAPTADPYGWGLLQRFGLSVTLSLRDPRTAAVLAQDKILMAIGTVLALFDQDEPTDEVKKQRLFFPHKLFRHLHVEALFQPGKSVSLQPDVPINMQQLLSLIQLSLRPIPIQQLRYTEMAISGPQGFELELKFGTLSDTVSMILQSDTNGEQIELAANPGETKPLIHRFTLPLSGKMKILLRGKKRFALQAEADEQRQPLSIRYKLQEQLLEAGKLPPHVTSVTEDNNVYLEFATVPPKEQSNFEAALGKPDKPMGTFNMMVTETEDPTAQLTKREVLTEFAPTSENAAYFLVPVDALLTQSLDPTDAQSKQWKRLKAYLESLNSNGQENQSADSAARIEVPMTSDSLKKENLFAQILRWTQRFFDHCGPVQSAAAAQATEEMLYKAQFLGPWLATAYPRAGTPAFVTPDQFSRLEYYHLIEDKWAHTYRYTIRPFDRYQKLWRNLYLSPLLWPEEDESTQPPVDPPIPSLTAGGLDIVLDRTKPVTMPTILRSARLDRMSVPGQPAEPGKFWEVIIAQHREQALSERNQTVYRQLSFRHVAYTLLRRFAYEDTWLLWMAHNNTGEEPATPTNGNGNPNGNTSPIDVTAPSDSANIANAGQDGADKIAFPAAFAYPTDETARLPETYENTSTILDKLYQGEPLSQEAGEDKEAIRFALPQRLDQFQQGALVVQWEALPFYYAHRMLVIAQTTTQVSPVNSVIQQDFEYRAPEPGDPTDNPLDMEKFRAYFMEGADKVATRRIQIPLRRLWDSLPEAVQQRWPDENPHRDLQDAGADDQPRLRRPGFLPDPEVVYQIIEYFQGNIEVQVEIYFRTAGTTNGEEQSTAAEQPVPLLYAKRQLGQRQTVNGEPTVVPLDGRDLHAVCVELEQQDEAGVLQWDHEIIVAETPNGSPAPFTDPEALDHVRLRWVNHMPTPIQEVVNALPGDELFKRGLSRLSTTAANVTDPVSEVEFIVSEEQVPLGLDQLPSAVADGLTYANLQIEGLPHGARLAIIEGPAPADAATPADTAEEEKTHYVALRWTGPLFVDQQEERLATLQGFFKLTEIVTALPLLMNQLGKAVFTAPYTGALTPETFTIPTPLTTQLALLIAEDGTKMLRFIGQPVNTSQWEALTTLPNQVDPPEVALSTAIAELVTSIQSHVVEVPLTMAKRPRQDALPPAIRESLMLGRLALQYTGILSVQKASSLIQLFAEQVDKAAIQRLYYRSVEANLRSRVLKIRTRRGSAQPSDARLLEPLLITLPPPSPDEGGPTKTVSTHPSAAEGENA